MRNCLLAAKNSALNRNIDSPSALFSVGNRSAASEVGSSRLRKLPVNRYMLKLFSQSSACDTVRGTLLPFAAHAAWSAP